MKLAPKLLPCKCGCGKLAPVASQTRTRDGVRKGERQYARGHTARSVVFEYNGNTKICTKCPEQGLQPVENFNRCKRSPDGHKAMCKDCKRKDAKRYYHTSPGRKERQAAHDARMVERNRQIILDHLVVGCADCGNIDIRVLEFHHVETKTGNISHLVRSASAERLIAEINRCIVLCANCHRIRTTDQCSWWKGGRS